MKIQMLVLVGMSMWATVAQPPPVRPLPPGHPSVSVQELAMELAKLQQQVVKLQAEVRELRGIVTTSVFNDKMNFNMMEERGLPPVHQPRGLGPQSPADPGMMAPVARPPREPVSKRPVPPRK